MTDEVDLGAGYTKVESDADFDEPLSEDELDQVLEYVDSEHLAREIKKLNW